MILQDNPTDFEKHEWGFSERINSAAWYLPCLGWESLGQRGRESQAGLFLSDKWVGYEEHFQI